MAGRSNSNWKRLSGLPGFGRLTVALFATIMLAVCIWGGWTLVQLYDSPAKGSVVERNVQQSPAELSAPTNGGNSRLKQNLAKAQTQVNGQLLLYAGLGLVYLFTTASPRTKKFVLGSFGVAIVVFMVSRAGSGFHQLFDSMLLVSGLTILALCVYMCFMIYRDLGRKRKVKA